MTATVHSAAGIAAGTGAGIGASPAGLDVDGRDPLGADMASGATGLLAVFNRAGVLAPADVHVARMLGRVAEVADESVLLAAAFAVRAPRLGHVRVDLASISETATREIDDAIDLRQLPWPAPDEWVDAVRKSTLAGADRPLRLQGDALYLDRYWALERQVAADLQLRAALGAPAVDESVVTAGLDLLFAPDDTAHDPLGGGAGAVAPLAASGAAGTEPAVEPGPDWQRVAAETAVRRRLSIIAGGPGTGKTTTIARVIVLLYDQAMKIGGSPPLIALAAPTGKAAARLAEAVHDEASRLDIDASVRKFMNDLKGTTIHRLLRSSPQNRTRFRHNRTNRLIHDAVIVDETSMVPLSLMARLIEAVRPEARLIFAGDPEQLASVEAGAVLGDIVGPARAGGGVASPAGEAGTGSGAIRDTIVVLRKTRRFAGILASLASAIQAGDADRVMELLAAGDPKLQWIEVEDPVAAAGNNELRTLTVAAGTAVVAAAGEGRVRDALDAMAEFRILCGHRHGPAGALVWGDHVEKWLADAIPGLLAGGAWYPGRPLLVTANDYSLNLFNGDTGVVVAGRDGRVAAAFERAGGTEEVSPARLGSVESAHAMTIHKSQGSQFRTVAVVLPGADSPILTRELLYTAVTRAREKVILIASAASVRAALDRPITRSSGLRDLLWDE